MTVTKWTGGHCNALGGRIGGMILPSRTRGPSLLLASVGWPPILHVNWLSSCSPLLYPTSPANRSTGGEGGEEREMDANWILFILSRKKKRMRRNFCEINTLVCGKTTLIDSMSWPHLPIYHTADWRKCWGIGKRDRFSVLMSGLPPPAVVDSVVGLRSALSRALVGLRWPSFLWPARAASKYSGQSSAFFKVFE